MEEIPANLFANNSKITTFAYTFTNCNKLVAIPEGLFDNNPEVNNFNATFNNCYNVTSNVPELWVSHPDAQHKNCYYACVNATNYNDIPDDWK